MVSIVSALLLIADEIDALITVFLQSVHSKVSYNTYFDIFPSDGDCFKNELSLA